MASRARIIDNLSHPDARALFDHPRNRYVGAAPGGRGFLLKTQEFVRDKHGVNQHKQIALRGVERLIKDIFFQEYVYVPDEYGRTSGSKTLRGGIERGSKVHKQLQGMINMKPERFRQRWKESELCPQTKLLEKYLEFWKLKPQFAEMIIYDQALRVGSAIDAIAENEYGDLMLIDWKTGYTYSFDKGYGQVTNLLPYVEDCNDEVKEFVRTLNDSPKHAAFFQVLIYKSMLRELYGIHIQPQNVVVIQTPDEKHVVPHFIPEHLLLLETRIYRAFCEEVKRMDDAAKVEAAERKKRKSKEYAAKRREEKARKKAEEAALGVVPAVKKRAPRKKQKKEEV